MLKSKFQKFIEVNLPYVDMFKIHDNLPLLKKYVLTMFSKIFPTISQSVTFLVNTFNRIFITISSPILLLIHVEKHFSATLLMLVKLRVQSISPKIISISSCSCTTASMWFNWELITNIISFSLDCMEALCRLVYTANNLR